MMDEKTKKNMTGKEKEEIEGKNNGTNLYRKAFRRWKNHTDQTTGV